MNNNHYPSLELCKKLKEIGFPETEHSFNHRAWPEHCYWLIVDCEIMPSVMEMLDVMPELLHLWPWKNNIPLRIYWKNCVSYHETFNAPIKEFKNTLPNALAEMILWLVENNHLTFN